MYHILFIHSSLDEHLVCFHFGNKLWWMMLPWTCVCNYFCGLIPSFLLGAYLGVELLGHMVTIFNLLKVVFQRHHTILYSHKCMTVPISQHPCQRLSLLLFFQNHSHSCEVVLRSHFDLHFLMTTSIIIFPSTLWLFVCFPWINVYLESALI